MNSRILMFTGLAAGLALAQNTQNSQQDRSNSTTRDSSSSQRSTSTSRSGQDSSSSQQNSTSSGHSSSSQDSTSSTTGRGGHPGTTSLSSSERNFLMKAAEGGRMEVELGQRAASQGSSEQVKSFGQRMVDDHTKANQKLEQIASSKGITLDKSKSSSSGKAGQMMNMSGEQFDRAYMRHMVSDHQKDVSEFEKMSNNAKDPEVKAFASETLPTLREHLQQARSINQSLGSMSGRGSSSNSSSSSSHDSNSSSSSSTRSTDSSNSGNTNRRDNTNQTNPTK